MDLSKKFDYIERTYIDREFMDAFWLSRQLLEGLIENNDELVSSVAHLIYPKIRFILENYGRYEFALDFIDRDDTVLDVPCGSGYGSGLLASYASKVYAIDIDQEAVDYARDKYGYPNIEFSVGDMMNGDLPNVDVIVCFEGLEHITPGEYLIKIFIAALNENGRLILSVPINENYIRSDMENPFHLEEYDLEKLSGLLERYFGSVTYFGVDVYGGISSIDNAFNSIVAVCEV